MSKFIDIPLLFIIPVNISSYCMLLTFSLHFLCSVDAPLWAQLTMTSFLLSLLLFMAVYFKKESGEGGKEPGNDSVYINLHYFPLLLLLLLCHVDKWGYFGAVLLCALSLFTMLPCGIRIKQHCTGLWEHRDQIHRHPPCPILHPYSVSVRQSAEGSTIGSVPGILPELSSNQEKHLQGIIQVIFGILCFDGILQCNPDLMHQHPVWIVIIWTMDPVLSFFVLHFVGFWLVISFKSRMLLQLYIIHSILFFLFWTTGKRTNIKTLYFVASQWPISLF